MSKNIDLAKDKLVLGGHEFYLTFHPWIGKVFTRPGKGLH